MKTLRLRLFAGLSMGFIAFFVVGCVCPSNRKAGFAQIVCQPVDTTVKVGRDANFTVEASGNDLQFQWYHDDDPIEGKTNFDLSVPKAKSSDLGFYSCVIGSTDKHGKQRFTKTREAALGLLKPRGDIKGLAETNLFMMGEQQPMPPSFAGTVACDNVSTKYCGCVVFDNADNLYKATSTTCRLSVQVVSNLGIITDIPPSKYALLWIIDKKNKDCAQTVDSAPSGKQFTSTVNSLYSFAVYFKTGACPPKKSSVILTVDFL